MPLNKYGKIKIGDDIIDVNSNDDIGISISYVLENRENFQQKESSKALDLTVPATPKNSKNSNTYHNPLIADLTPGQVYKKSRPAVIEINGQELINGKAFLKSSDHTDRPSSYSYDIYGDNADWAIDLKESTLYDFVKSWNFTMSRAKIIESWDFDGMNPNLPYVFAPVRYGNEMDELNGIQDYSMAPEYMKPAISKYWIIFNAFKSLGYRIKSDFFDSSFFRRQVMPWTWGNFLTSPGTRLDNLDFLAKSTQEFKFKGDFLGFFDTFCSNETTNGAFDNNGVYNYDAGTKEGKFTYVPAFSAYGLLSATFHLSVYIDASATAKSAVRIRVQYFKNGIKLDNGNDDGNGTLLTFLKSQTTFQSKSFTGVVDDWLTIQINPGDVISFKIWGSMDDSTFGSATFLGNIDAFEMDYFKIPLGGSIDFSGYTNFKKYKFLDFFAGVVDEFNLCFKTDVANKVVYIEPEHPYSLVHNQAIKDGGYFNGKMLDWSAKQDLSKKNTLVLFSDSERELSFAYKEDDNDGTYKTVKDRTGGNPALGKYVFSERFKTGPKTIENRFFSVVMHYNVVQWIGLGTLSVDSPQMICLIPENVSNTSKDEAQNTFMPKSAYYKGLVPEWGWVFDGAVRDQFPFMFAVNYKTGGHEDPILSYCNEQIGTYALKTTGIGLVRRFYLQRLAIMEEGDYYSPAWFKLNNNDIANFMHREYIICRGAKWQVIEIKDYNPFKEESTQVYLRKWSPITNA